MRNLPACRLGAMRLLGLSALLFAMPAFAQSGPPGGGPPGGGAREGGPPRIREVKPIKREAFDKAVTAMFRTADGDRSGIVTIDELRAIAAARRDVLIGERFERIDADRDRQIGRDEFFAWQHSLGSVAQSEEAQAVGRGGPIAETVAPDVGDGPGSQMLADLIEPLSAGLIARANMNYDAGLALDELLAHEGKRFDAADRDGDGEISMGEMRRPEGPAPRGPNGAPPPVDR